MFKKDDFNYYLPEELIAQKPVYPRNSSRLMVVDKDTGDIENSQFSELSKYLREGDLLVLNNSKVIPARIYISIDGRKSGGELLLLKQIDAYTWEGIVRPGKKLREGAGFSAGEGLLKGEIERVLDSGNRIIKFSYEGNFFEILDRIAEMPLPPYITEKLLDKDRYQTVYAKDLGSAAAPTAGLHFTKEMLYDLEGRGIKIAYVTLHVGLGTFRPVKEENILDHKMHSESFYIPKESAQMLIEQKKSGGRIICVGTTSLRTIESAFDNKGNLLYESGDTEIFIYPGYEFKMTDALITNFHLPESTLIMLVSALLGREKTLSCYKKAVEEKYRFFSFGDAMFIK